MMNGKGRWKKKGKTKNEQCRKKKKRREEVGKFTQQMLMHTCDFESRVPATYTVPQIQLCRRQCFFGCNCAWVLI